MTLAASGLDLKDFPKTLKELQAARRKSHRNLFPAAAVHQMVRANQNIIERAAMDDDSIYGRFLALHHGWREQRQERARQRPRSAVRLDLRVAGAGASTDVAHERPRGPRPPGRRRQGVRVTGRGGGPRDRQ